MGQLWYRAEVYKTASVTIGILQIGDLIDEYEDDEDGDYEEERHDIKKFESIQRELKKKEKQRIAKISRDLDVLEKDLGRDSIEWILAFVLAWKITRVLDWDSLH